MAHTALVVLYTTWVPCGSELYWYLNALWLNLFEVFWSGSWQVTTPLVCVFERGGGGGGDGGASLWLFQVSICMVPSTFCINWRFYLSDRPTQMFIMLMNISHPGNLIDFQLALLPLHLLDYRSKSPIRNPRLPEWPIAKTADDSLGPSEINLHIPLIQ